MMYDVDVDELETVTIGDFYRCKLKHTLCKNVLYEMHLPLYYIITDSKNKYWLEVMTITHLQSVSQSFCGTIYARW